MSTAEELLIEVLALDSAIHRTYPSTAVCWGGIGGQMLTGHCSLECDNPKHGEVNKEWRILKSNIHKYLEEARNANTQV